MNSTQVTPFRSTHSFTLDLRWVLDELIRDQWISVEDANMVAGLPQGHSQMHMHPLQRVAEARLRRQLLPSVDLDITLLTEWMSLKSGLDVFHVDPMKVDVPAITAVMSYQFAHRHGILAVNVESHEILIATAEPFHTEWEQGLAQVVRNKSFKRVLVNPTDLHKYTLEFYNLSKSVAKANTSPGQSKVNSFEQLLQIGDLKAADANDQHIVKIVDWLLQYAFDQRSSDIHLEPRRDKGRIRFRIDGVLHDVYELPAVVMSAVVSRIKILGRMNVAEKRRPQDGRLKTATPDGNETELRLATLPTAFGEKLVMRIFDPDVLVRSFQELGLTTENYETWQTFVTKPNGIVLVTGPTGSGKTTTLYSTLKQLASSRVNVCTIEDPIEMIEPSFNQMQVQSQMDLGFAEGLKALLRQDPDIIMVGEIRDLETAEMAIQAALTGHLVISTLHTTDAASAVTRLIDLGVAPYLVAATVNGVMAQRLLRTLCPECKSSTTIAEDQWRMMTAPWRAKMPEAVYQPEGCLACRDTGYYGRVGVYEIMPMTHELKELVSQNAPLESIRQLAFKQGMKSLRLGGAQKVAHGLTTFEEVLRVTPSVSAKS